MKIYTEISLSNFEPWSGAVDTFNKIYNEGKCDELETILEELYPDGMTETQLNDLLWFEPETVFEWLGIRSEEKIQDEIDELKEELEELVYNWTEECEELELDLDDERQALWVNDYKFDYDELKEKIKELEEELETY